MLKLNYQLAKQKKSTCRPRVRHVQDPQTELPIVPAGQTGRGQPRAALRDETAVAGMLKLEDLRVHGVE